MIANSFELTINFLNSSIIKTENDTDIIIAQSADERTFVDNKPPISIPIIGMDILANWTKKNNNPNDTKNAMLIALFEKAPKENILSS